VLNRLAFFVSVIFEPFLVTFLSWILIVAALEALTIEKMLWLLLVVIVSGLPPILILLYEKSTGKVTSWFLTQRLERRDIEAAWFLGSFLLSLGFWLLDAPRLLLAASVTLFLLSLGVTVVNFFWKISVHMVGVSFFVMMLLLVYSPGWLWLTLLLPVVAWSRIRLGHHTLTQVTVGTIVTILITYFSFSLFGLATF